MSHTITALSAALPLAAGWSLHGVRLRRRLVAARRDPLSGLYRREAFEAKASRLLEGRPLGVLVVDLDGFKAVNDTYGHAAGDAVIAAVGTRLAAIVAGRGIAGRLGGDEFALAVRLPDSSVLGSLLRQTSKALQVPVTVDGQTLPLGASVGGLWTGQLPTSDLSAAMRRADEAMYAAKQDGGGWLMVYGSRSTRRTVNGRRAGRRGTSGEAA
ncbi:GGDEF domain-containing protein [Streptomyces sp. NPDC040724]|uniref:GGDEF domain-containing protein n=1 Tax=Streptomyces sp. NPDC040724 TaxID=3155612 RepID=UPI0033D25DD2